MRDLLDLARMNRREFAVDAEQINLAEIGREAVRRYEGEARAGGIELDAFADEEATATDGPVLQVMSNLVENALVDATGRLRTVRARSGVIEVVDTGVGLAPEDVPHAFERFYLHDRVGIPDGRRWAPASVLPSSRSSASAWAARSSWRARSARARRSRFGCPRRRGPAVSPLVSRRHGAP